MIDKNQYDIVSHKPLLIQTQKSCAYTDWLKYNETLTLAKTFFFIICIQIVLVQTFLA